MATKASSERDELEQALLRAQIENLTSVGEDFSIKDFIPAVSAFVVVLVGGIIAALVINSFWNARIDRAEAELEVMKEQRLALEMEISMLGTGQDGLEAGNGHPSGPVDTTVNFHSCNSQVCSFTVESSTPGAEIEIYGPCSGDFAVPGEIPILGNANCPVMRESRMCNASGNRTMCRFGPFRGTDMEKGWWMSAVADGEHTVRYINSVHID